MVLEALFETLLMIFYKRSSSCLELLLGSGSWLLFVLYRMVMSYFWKLRMDTIALSSKGVYDWWAADCSLAFWRPSSSTV